MLDFKSLDSAKVQICTDGTRILYPIPTFPDPKAHLSENSLQRAEQIRKSHEYENVTLREAIPSTFLGFTLAIRAVHRQTY